MPNVLLKHAQEDTKGILWKNTEAVQMVGPFVKDRVPSHGLGMLLFVRYK